MDQPLRWAAPASLALSLAGLGLSIYLTIEHYTAPGTLACPANSTVDCARVTTSPQSTVAGIPVAVLGIVFFVAAAVLCLPALWRSANGKVRGARLGVAALGMVFVVYLIFAELFLVNAFCLWCTAVHLVTFALFGVIALGHALTEP
jgi:uncharacterized membrane protein